MKTRSNMPLFVLETNDITKLTDRQIDLLRCGDWVTKKTGNQKHNYIVTYKEEKHGICLSYFNAGYSETISYDYTDGHWVYNSKDVSDVSDYVTKTQNLPLPATAGQGGKVLGVNADGTAYELKTIEGATPIYYHGINLYDFNNPSQHTLQFHILNNTNTLINSVDKIKAWANSITGEVIIGCNGAFFNNGVGGVAHALVKVDSTSWDIYYVDSTGSHAVSGIDIADYFDAVQDAVNQVL